MNYVFITEDIGFPLLVLGDAVCRLMKMDVVKDAHTAIFSGQTKREKTHLVLDLLESEYRHGILSIF